MALGFLTTQSKMVIKQNAKRCKCVFFNSRDDSVSKENCTLPVPLDDRGTVGSDKRFV